MFNMNPFIRLRVITTLSATLEFFDFTLLIFLAPVMAANFFPDTSGLRGIMPVLMLFFAGYLARFFGGLVFAHGGDTQGRKRYYMISIITMSLSTLGIALLPTHEFWGAMAPFTLLLLRIFQGLSLGGEIPGAVVFASEYANKTKRGLVTGLVVSGVTFGNVLASGSVALLFYLFGEQAVYEWGWRLLFLFGSGLGLISLWLRRSLEETPVYESMNSKKRQAWPSLYLLKKNGMELTRGIILSSVPAVAVSVLFFMPRYEQHYLGLNQTSVLSISFIAFLLLTIISLAMAILSDRIGRLPLIWSGAFIMLFAVPIFLFFLSIGKLTPLIAISPLLISTGMIMGIYEASMVELFSTETRYTGVAFCHNFAFSFFGGITPMMLEWLCSKGYLLAPGLWLATLSLLLILLAIRWEDRYRAQLDSI